MPNVIGVRFKRAGKVYYFDPGAFALSQGEKAVVETARGVELGVVVVESREVPESDVVTPLKKVVRPASHEDLVKEDESAQKAKRAFAVAHQKIAEHGLPMKLVEAEYVFDGSKITFYFTSESRVDFRELVKDLAATFRTRIELRQIGVRDEAKMLGGLGHCGRQLCCQAFLGDFEPVSIRMAKDQNLSLNPAKISGICGRLMCCLKYESEAYKEAKRAAQEAAKAAQAAREAGTASPESAAAAEPVKVTKAEPEGLEAGMMPACGGCPMAGPSGKCTAEGDTPPCRRKIGPAPAEKKPEEPIFGGGSGAGSSLRNGGGSRPQTSRRSQLPGQVGGRRGRGAGVGRAAGQSAEENTAAVPQKPAVPGSAAPAGGTGGAGGAWNGQTAAAQARWARWTGYGGWRRAGTGSNGGYRWKPEPKR